MKKIKLLPGDLLKVPYKPGVHTFARILIEESYAFYDCPSSTQDKPYNDILQSDILFVAQVAVFPVLKGFWTVLTNLPLEPPLSTFYPRYFSPVPTSPENLNFYDTYKSEIEDAIKKDWIKTGKIQLAGIHEQEHIDSRINDYYDGKRNRFNKAQIELFKLMLGIPIN